MDRGALDHALEAGGRRRLGTVDVGDDAVQLLVEELDQRLAQCFEIHAAGAHDAGRIGLVDQGKQKMLESRQFMATLVGQPERVVDRLFEGFRE